MRHSASLSVMLSAMCLAGFASCSERPAERDNTLIVSIEPLHFVVEGIVGDDFDVVVLVPPGAGPETYEPTPLQVRAAEDARLVFSTGLIDFERVMLQRLPRPERFVNLSAGIELIAGGHSHARADTDPDAASDTRTGTPSDAASDAASDTPSDTPSEEHLEHFHDPAAAKSQLHSGQSQLHSGPSQALSAPSQLHSGPSQAHSGPSEAHSIEASQTPLAHAHAGVDPHIWVSPRALARMARTAFERIHRLYPDSVSYSANYAVLAERLAELDREVSRRIAASANRSFLIFHPGLTYLARDYGLRQIALEIDGKEPSVRQLAEIVNQARGERITRILYQREFPRRMVEVAAAEIGAEPVEIDILGYDIIANTLNIIELITGVGSTDPTDMPGSTSSTIPENSAADEVGEMSPETNKIPAR